MLQQIPTVLITAMPLSQHPYIDAGISLLPALIAVAGGLWAFYKYLRDKRDTFDKELRDKSDALGKELALKAQANETAKIESQKPFSAKQQEVYFDLLSTTSLIANRITEPKADRERAKAIEHFWVLFWGPLPVVADRNVAVAADTFSDALKSPMNFVPLRNASMDLARACRAALGDAWNLGLAEFEKGDAAIAKSNPKVVKPLPKRSKIYPKSGPVSA
jgi:hypothetical protein